MALRNAITCSNKTLDTTGYKEEEKKKNKEEEKSSQNETNDCENGLFFNSHHRMMSLNTAGLEHKLFYKKVMNTSNLSQEPQKMIEHKHGVYNSENRQYELLEMYCPNPLCRRMQYFEGTHVCKFCKGSQIMGENMETGGNTTYIDSEDIGFSEGVKTSEKRFYLEMFPEFGFKTDELAVIPDSEIDKVEFEDGEQIGDKQSGHEILNPLTELLIDDGWAKFAKRNYVINRTMEQVKWDEKTRFGNMLAGWAGRMPVAFRGIYNKMSELGAKIHNQKVAAEGGYKVWIDKKTGLWTDTYKTKKGLGRKEVKKNVFYPDRDFPKLFHIKAGVDLFNPVSEWEYTDEELQQMSNQIDCGTAFHMEYYEIECKDSCTWEHKHNFAKGAKFEIGNLLSEKYLAEREKAKHNVETLHERTRKGSILDDAKYSDKCRGHCQESEKLKWITIFVNKHADKIGKTVEDFDLASMSKSEASRTMWALNEKSRKRINDKNGDRFDTSLVVKGLHELVKICGKGVTRVVKEEKETLYSKDDEVSGYWLSRKEDLIWKEGKRRPFRKWVTTPSTEYRKQASGEWIYMARHPIHGWMIFQDYRQEIHNELKSCDRPFCATHNMKND